MPEGARIIEAATALAQMLCDDILAFDIGPKLTCAEADGVMELLRACGHDDAAEMWLEAHAEGDDEGDSHYQGEK